MILVPVLLFLACKGEKRESMPEICYLNIFVQKIKRVSLKDINRIGRLNSKITEVKDFYRCTFEEPALCPSVRACKLNKCLMGGFKISNGHFLR